MHTQITLPSVQNFGAWSPAERAAALFIITASAAAAVIAGLYSAGMFRADRRKAVIFFTAAAVPAVLLLICFFGPSAAAVRGAVFVLTAAFCSFSDIKTRECPDFPYLLIAVAAFIGFEPGRLPSMLFAAAAVFTLQLLGARITGARVNGADLKFSTVCAFMLGTVRGLSGFISGMILSIAVNLIKQKDRRKGFPLLPYLSAGFMAAFFV